MASHHARTGFTIWQVVIVLGILAVMFVIFWPVFQPVPGNSRRATCQSNMKQLGLAFIQYEQDNDGVIPPGVNATGNGWAGKIYSYAKSTGLYHCPEDRQDGNYISYAENLNAINQPAKNFALPSATVLLYEATTLNCDPSTSETNSGTGLSAPQDSKRHDQSTFQSTYSLNFLAMDGHVKYLQPKQVSNGSNTVNPKHLPQGLTVLTFAIK